MVISCARGIILNLYFLKNFVMLSGERCGRSQQSGESFRRTLQGKTVISHKAGQDCFIYYLRLKFLSSKMGE